MGQENIVEVKNQDQSDKAKNGNDFNAYVQDCLNYLIAFDDTF